MQETDDIDFILTLNPHGWSTCCFFIDGKRHELTISHVFGEPYIDFIKALSQLIQGNNTSFFVWYGEPGGERIELSILKERRNILFVNVKTFTESYGKEIKEFNQKLEF